MTSEIINGHLTTSQRQRSERNVLRGLVQMPLDTWPHASILRSADFVHYAAEFEVISYLITSYLKDGQRPCMSQAVLSSDQGIGADLAAELFEVSHVSTFTDGLHSVLNRSLSHGELMRIGKAANRCAEIAEDCAGIADATKPKQLVFHDAWEASFQPKPLKECIIEGMSRRGEVGNIIASTKTGKSWFALMLLICVAIGRDWLGRRVAKGPVLLIDNELHEETIENRLSAVREKMHIRLNTSRDRFEYVACRGNWLSLIDLMEQVREQYQPGELNLIVIDAKYRLFGDGLQENSNDDQTTFHNMVDRFAKEMDCLILLVHHSTKGTQTGKSVTDVGSGGGSQSRAVDLHLILRPHEQEGLAVLEAAVRSFAPVEPVSLQWNWPLWSVAHDVEPALKADKTRGDSRQESKDAAGIDDLKKILSESKEPLSRNAIHKQFGGGKDRLNRLIRVGLEKGSFVMAGSKEAQNGVVAELFTIASKEGANVQRSDSTV